MNEALKRELARSVFRFRSVNRASVKWVLVIVAFSRALVKWVLVNVAFNRELVK